MSSVLFRSVEPACSSVRATEDRDTREGDRPTGDALFPLPLAPFEHFMLLDDRRSHPMQFFCRLRFAGLLQRLTLEQAIGLALARHPLLRAVVEEKNPRRPTWHASERPLQNVDWLEQEPTDALPAASYLDIRQEPGLRLAAVVGQDRSDLVAQFHHVACDGAGAMSFLGDLLTAYARIAGGAGENRFKPLDVQRLRQRATFDLSWWKLTKMAAKQVKALHHLRRVYKRKPVPLVPQPNDVATALPQSYPAGWFHHFDRHESSALRQVTNGAETTLNNLLLRDLFLAMHDWRSQRGWASDDAWLRVGVPVSMRNPGDRRMPAANVVSLLFLDRRESEFADGDALLRGICEEMAAKIGDELGLTFALVLRGSRRFPAFLARILHKRRCLGSSLMTNVGPALANCCLPRRDGRLVIGNLVLDDVEVLPVLRPFQCLGFALSTYAGRVSVGMQYDPRVMSAEAARAALDTYVRQIRASIAKRPAATSGPDGAGIAGISRGDKLACSAAGPSL